MWHDVGRVDGFNDWWHLSCFFHALKTLHLCSWYSLLHHWPRNAVRRWKILLLKQKVLGILNSNSVFLYVIIDPTPSQFTLFPLFPSFAPIPSVPGWGCDSAHSLLTFPPAHCGWCMACWNDVSAGLLFCLLCVWQAWVSVRLGSYLVRTNAELK